MLFKVAICDDEEKDIQVIQRFLHIYEMQHDIDFEINTFQNSTKLLEKYDSAGRYNILFLDVEMPKLSGLEVAAHIREIPDRLAKIVFVSNFPEYMQDSGSLWQTKGLIMKEKKSSFTGSLGFFEDFEKLLFRIIKSYRESENASFLLKEDGAEEVIFAENIIAIHSINAKKKRIQIFLEYKTIEAYGVLSEWEKKLNSDSFFCPCRGYLVNLNRIHFIKDKELIMSNNEKIPLSRRQEKELRSIFSKKLLSINQVR